MRAIVLFTLALVACSPDAPQYCYSNDYLTLKHYELNFTEKTPGGIWVDPTGQGVDLTLIDRLTDELEACLAIRVNRECIGVKIPDDWFVSPCSDEELLPIPANDSLCLAKGVTSTPECPCNWRVETQDDNIVVIPPSLKLLKAELARIVTGENNVWVVPDITKCL